MRFSSYWASLSSLNDGMRLGVSQALRPNGHTELYLLLGLAIADFRTWWFGWFDRER